MRGIGGPASRDGSPFFCPLSADTGCGVIGKGLRAEGPLRMGGRRSSKRLIEINTTPFRWPHHRSSKGPATGADRRPPQPPRL